MDGWRVLKLATVSLIRAGCVGKFFRNAIKPSLEVLLDVGSFKRVSHWESCVGIVPYCRHKACLLGETFLKCL